MADKNYLLRYGEPALGLLSGVLAEPVAGWAGLLSGGDAGRVESTRKALTYQPRTAEGKAGQQAMAETMAGVKRVMVDENRPVRMALDGYNALTDRAGAVSPMLGAALATAPAALGLLAGPGSSLTRSAISTVGRDVVKGAVSGAKVAGENLATPAVRGLMADQRGAVTWHGTPHKFDKFDASKIGTGEGAQAYGHGIYVADSPSVASSYRNTLSTNPSAANDVANTYVAAAGGDRKNAAKAFKDYIGYDTEGPFALKAGEKSSADETIQAILSPPGSIYKIHLPDEHIARMLDWDKPLTEQPQNVLQALRGLGDQHPRLREAMQPFEMSTTTGATVNRIMSGSGGDALAADILQKAGIPGIRYLDGSSRAAGTGTSNYVVFPGNEGMLSIMERNGQPLLGGQ